MFGSLVINFVERGDWKNAGHGRTETGVDPGREKWLQKIPHKTALHPMIRTAKSNHLIPRRVSGSGVSIGPTTCGTVTGTGAATGTAGMARGVRTLAVFSGSRVISGMYDPRGRLMRNSEVNPYFP